MKMAEKSSRRSMSGNRVIVAMLAMLIILFTSGMAFASSEGGHGEGATKGWVKEDTYRVMNFAVLAVALFFVLRKPASQALKGRIKGIEEQLRELEQKKKDARTELAEYNKRLKEMEKEAETILADYEKQGNEAKVRILKEAETAAEKLEEQAKKNIANEFARTKSQLQGEIMELALNKAEEIIRKKITDEDQDRLVDEYIEKVVA